MRVVMVHPFDPLGSKIGGIETMIRSMIAHAPPEFEVEVIGVTENPAERPVGCWSNITLGARQSRLFPIFSVTAPNRRSRIPLFLQFPLLALRRAPECRDAVLIFHRWEPGIVYRNSSAVRILCLHANPEEWAGPLSEVRWRHAPWALYALERWLLPSFRRIYVVGLSGLSAYRSRFPWVADRFSFLSTCFDSECYTCYTESEREYCRRKLLAQTGWPESARIILFSGRMEAQKNPELAAETLARVSQKCPDIRGVWIGTGSLLQAAKAIMQRVGLESNVVFYDGMTPNQLAEVMNACDLMLLTSRFESMPIVVWEAQACGLPVVSTPVGEVERMIQPDVTGGIAEPSSRTLAQSVLDMLERMSPELRRQCAEVAAPQAAPQLVLDFFKQIDRLLS